MDNVHTTGEATDSTSRIDTTDGDKPSLFSLYKNKGMWFVDVDGMPVDIFYTVSAANRYIQLFNQYAARDKSFEIDFEESDADHKALDISAVYTKYRQTINMSASSLQSWSENDCSRRASLNRSPITRNLNLLRKKRNDWTQADARNANRTISFVERMRGMPKGKPVVNGCPSKRDISLRNWAYNPGSKGLPSKLMKSLYIVPDDVPDGEKRSVFDTVSQQNYVDISVKNIDGSYAVCNPDSRICLPAGTASGLTEKQRQRLLRISNRKAYKYWEGMVSKSMQFNARVPEDIAHPVLWEQALTYARKNTTINGSYTTRMVLDKYEELGGKYKSTNLIKSVTELDNGDVKITVVGIPFKGVREDNGDLIGDIFTKSTDLGILKKVPTYFDHGKSDDWIAPQIDEMKASGALPEDFSVNAFGREMIGQATMVGVTDEGVLYDIIVERRHRYKNLLKRLAEEGHIAASSKAVMRYPETPPAVLKMWHVGSMDLTPSPMNNAARVVLEKSLEIDMSDTQNTPQVEEDQNAVQVPESLKDRTEKAFEDALNGQKATPDADENIPEEENAIESNDQNKTPESDETEMTVAVALQKSLNLLEAQGQKIDRLLEENALQRKRIDTLEKTLSDIGEAIPSLGAQIAKSLRVTVREESRKTETITEPEAAARKSLQIDLAKRTGPSVANAASGAPGF